jgi:predicted  nucleic acid-binding Zn-ribbon protein
VASEAYEQILAVQELDLSIGTLNHRVVNHPTRAEVAAVDQRLAASDAEASEVEERRHALTRDQKRLEDEVASIAAKRSDIDAKLYGGEVTASKELLALQDEAATLLERQTGLEDEELDIMERVEAVDAELATISEARSQMEAERAGHQADLDRAVAEIETELATLDQRRTDAAATANAELLARYEELRSLYDGVAVARLDNGRCDGCHIQLSAVAVDQIAKMAEDAVVICEECGRLLVR